MKNWQIAAVLTFLIMGTVMMSGCISPGSKNPPAVVVSTPTPQIVYVTVTITPAPTSTPVLKTVLFSDDLSRWRSEWDSESVDDSGKTFYSGGSLHILDKDPPTGTNYHILNKNFNDFILDVDTKTIDGTLNNWQGVDVRRQDNDNYYGLDISADGYYAIVKFVNGNRQGLTGSKGIYSSYIKTGIGATNHIRAEANKNSLSLSVNGYHLSTVTDNSFKEGKIALTANSLTSGTVTDVAFNNLVITQI
jgi:hypothetical protein